jgi:hypothetical protein
VLPDRPTATICPLLCETVQPANQAGKGARLRDLHRHPREGTTGPIDGLTGPLVLRFP